MAAKAAGFKFLGPITVTDRARLPDSWLRLIAPDTHQPQAIGDKAACRLMALPTEKNVGTAMRP